MSEPLFRGAIPALVTPFRDGALDESAFRALVERQIDAGVHGLVPVGTTGEAPTLSPAERDQKRLNNFVDRFESFYGTLSPTQVQLLRQQVQQRGWFFAPKPLRPLALRMFRFRAARTRRYRCRGSRC